MIIECSRRHTTSTGEERQIIFVRKITYGVEWDLTACEQNINNAKRNLLLTQSNRKLKQKFSWIVGIVFTSDFACVCLSERACISLNI